MVSACFFLFCLFAPVPSVPDGAGGYVPYTNSRVMPDGSLRPYDPALDGIPPPSPYGTYIAPMPQAPLVYPYGQGYQPDYGYPGGYAAPRQSSYAAPRPQRAPAHAGQGCYDRDGQFIGANNPACY